MPKNELFGIVYFVDPILFMSCVYLVQVYFFTESGVSEQFKCSLCRYTSSAFLNVRRHIHSVKGKCRRGKIVKVAVKGGNKQGNKVTYDPIYRDASQ